MVDETIDYLKRVKQTPFRDITYVETHSGNYNANHVFVINGEKCIVRMSLTNDAEYPTDKIEEEFLALNILSGTGVAPEAYYFEKNAMNGNSILIEEFLDGEPATVNAKNIDEFADLLAKLHANQYAERGFLSKPTQKPYSLVQDFQAYCETRWARIRDDTQDRTMDALMPRIGSFIAKNEQLFSGIRNFSLTQNDPDPRNFIKTPSGLRMIDFEFAHLGVKEREVADFFLKSGITGEQQEAFLQSYSAMFEDSELLRERVRVKYVYNAACRAVWAVDRLQQITNGTLDSALMQRKALIEGYLANDVSILQQRFGQ